MVIVCQSKPYTALHRIRPRSCSAAAVECLSLCAEVRSKKSIASFLCPVVNENHHYKNYKISLVSLSSNFTSYHYQTFPKYSNHIESNNSYHLSVENMRFFSALTMFLSTMLSINGFLSSPLPGPISNHNLQKITQPLASITEVNCIESCVSKPSNINPCANEKCKNHCQSLNNLATTGM